MGVRFVVLRIKKGNSSSPPGISMDLLMLPPSAGFVANVEKMAAMGKSRCILLFLSKVFN